MKTVAAVLALCYWLAGPAFAGTLSAAEAEKLRAEIMALTAAVERGDPEPLIKKTHPSLHALMGGAENFAQLTRQAVTQLPQSGIKFLSSTVGMPTRTYAAGAEEVCFVPKTAVMEVQGKKAKTTNFMIAIRPAKGGAWQYLDGAGLKENSEMLYQLLPKLAVASSCRRTPSSCCDVPSLALHAFEQQLRHLPRLLARLIDRAADSE